MYFSEYIKIRGIEKGNNKILLPEETELELTRVEFNA